MNKSELVDAIAESAEVTKTVAARMVNSLVLTVSDALSKGDQVVIPGFGTFSVGNRSARTGRNPQTGQTIEIKASRVAKFKVGKALKEAVQ
jgi:DNA-binding protein HU-beta